MYDMTNVGVADLLAGGPRDDLDDVVITDPVPVKAGVYMVPDNQDLLAFLRRITEEHEMVSTFKACLAAEFTDAETGERVVPEWDDVAATIRAADAKADSYGAEMRTRMWNRLGQELFERCPHLRAYQVHEVLVGWGYQRSKWAFYKHLERQGLSAQARDKRLRREAAARKGSG